MQGLIDSVHAAARTELLHALQRLESIVFQTFTLKLRKRYVCHHRCEHGPKNALPGIQFILDKEKDSNLPFLDILVERLPASYLCLWKAHAL